MSPNTDRTGDSPRTDTNESSEQEPADAISEAFSERAWTGHRERVLDEYDLPEAPHPHAGEGESCSDMQFTDSDSMRNQEGDA